MPRSSHRRQPRMINGSSGRHSTHGAYAVPSASAPPTGRAAPTGRAGRTSRAARGPWRRPSLILPALLAAAVLSGGGGLVLADASTSAASLTASYETVGSWTTGYTGRYTITNVGSSPSSNWRLSFRLPAGTTITSMWNSFYKVSDGTVAVTPVFWSGQSWDGTIQPGRSLTVGFVTAAGSTAGQPADCVIDGTACGGGPAAHSSPPVTKPSAHTTSTGPVPTTSTMPSPSPTPATSTGSGTGPATTAGFSPYVDTSLFPPFNLVTAADKTGVKQFNLAFVVTGSGSCTPEWGGVTAIGDDAVTAQIGALRKIGGNVRVSFGGEDGSELAQTCTSVSQLAAAYQKVISAYSLTEIDFDIEGAAQEDTAANARRDQALAALQATDKNLQVSFTLPVLPSELTADGLNIVTGALKAGVKISAVDVMAMDYGDATAPDPSGQMGTYAVDAATATDAQVAKAMGISDTAAWPKIAVTPMIGQNDETDEVFTLANAQQLASFAASKHLAWISMWSAGRDSECSGGTDKSAQPTCSGIVQSADAFMKALGTY